MALRSHAMFLADDLLLGRATGSPGERIAALYVQAQLARAGIPGGAQGGAHLQPVPIVEARIDAARSTLTIALDGDALQGRFPDDAVVAASGLGALRDFGGDAVFVGDAARALAAPPEADAALHGRVAVLASLPGSAAATLIPRWTAAGVSGVLVLLPDAESFLSFRAARGEVPSYVDAEIMDPIWQPALPMVVIGPGLSAALLERVAAAGPGTALPLPLAARVVVALAVERTPRPAHNVLGLLPGSDPDRGHEIVVLSAHLDHLGVGVPDASGDSIYNGFSDNAAGVGMALAIADALARRPPARSVLFAFFTGEERGLLGSTYFADHPTVPFEHIVAAVNLDAGAPPAPPMSWRLATGEDRTLADLAIGVARARGWRAEAVPASANSDHWPFVARGVPAVFVIPGEEWEGISGMRRDTLKARWDHYHRPSDEWSPDFPLGGLERYASFALEIVRATADAETTALPRAAPPLRGQSPDHDPFHLPFVPLDVRREAAGPEGGG